jgi:hypothetical protein
MIATPIESAITFEAPFDPRAPGNFPPLQRSEIGSLLSPLGDMGAVATAAQLYENEDAMLQSQVRSAGGEAVLFLRSISRFVGGSSSYMDELMADGEHVFSALLQDEQAQQAGRALGDGGMYGPVSRLTAGYQVGSDRGFRYPIDEVSVGAILAGHPAVHSAFARLAMTQEQGRHVYTMRAGSATIGHDGRPKTEEGLGFSVLSLFGSVLDDLPDLGEPMHSHSPNL